jgi:hypothetical protein
MGMNTPEASNIWRHHHLDKGVVCFLDSFKNTLLTAVPMTGAKILEVAKADPLISSY